MDSIEILPLLSRWLHILAALIIASGIFFQWLVSPVVSSNVDTDEHQSRLRTNWSRWVMISITFLLISGLYNAAIKEMTYEVDMVYRGLLGLKILLAFVLFFLISTLAGRSERAQRFRAAGSRWYAITGFLIVLVVCIGGFMKLMSHELKIEGDAEQAQYSSQPIEQISYRSAASSGSG